MMDFAGVPFVFDGREKAILPKDFTPGPEHVIIGRGKQVQMHPANRRFRTLIQSQLEAYSNAATKGLKSNILWRVLHEVRSYCPSRLGFVKRDTDSGRWYAIDDANAKINISQAFRDGLHSDYKSSKKRKQIKRKAEMDEPNQQESQLEMNIFEALTHFDSNLDSSSSPPKRACVATNEKLSAPHSSDLSIGRLDSTMDRLRSFLANPPTLTEGNQISMTDLKSKRNESWDTFAQLYRKFGSQSKITCDPFEPKPIVATSSLKNATFGQVSNNVFPSFAMSNMVEESNPPEPVASLESSEKKVPDFDAVAPLHDTILPSILSLNSLELSDTGTLNELSSLSTIEDCHEMHDAWDLDRDDTRSAVLRAS